MEHDIGCKIKAARIEKKLTQEQVANREHTMLF